MDGHRTLRRPVRAATFLSAALIAAAALTGCGWDYGPEPGDPSDPVTPSSGVAIDVTGDPQVAYDEATGKTNAVVQFIARDKAGNPLDAEDVVVTMYVDGAAVDNESILSADSEELSSSIHLGLVLDASYSMLLHNPPAFDPMLEAARDAVVQGIELYAGRAGDFTWDVSWFNETLAGPSSAGRDWQPDDLLSIPEPGEGTATKLFAAVQHQADAMLEAYADVANGPRDHHVMAVLSDGADNYSWFDNHAMTSSGVTASGAPYVKNGWRSAALDSAVAAIDAHPKLTVHVAGMGSAISDEQLSAIARAGDGVYVKNPDSSQIGRLFDIVTREFATIQDHGATMPLQPGDYGFTVRVATLDGRSADSYSFRFHAGDVGAGLLP
jgi:hypothetical protein